MPKGAVHCTGGYMLWTYSTRKSVFGIRDEDNEIKGEAPVAFVVLKRGAPRPLCSAQS